MNKELFLEELKKLGILLTPKQEQDLDTYYKLLISYNNNVNLTAITKEEDVYLKHFYDSLTLFKGIDLKENLKNKTLPIKTLLLDQKLIAGIGNIYADEILFLSKINPHRKGKSLNDEELEKIIENTNNNYVEFNKIKNAIREEVGKYLYYETECKPMIITVIQEV